MTADSLGWIVAGLAVGLYVGELGRRRAMDRILTFGSPALNLRKPTSMAPAKEAEDRIHDFSEDTIQRAVDDLRQKAEKLGFTDLSDNVLRADAIALLQGQSVEPMV